MGSTQTSKPRSPQRERGGSSPLALPFACSSPSRFSLHPIPVCLDYDALDLTACMSVLSPRVKRNGSAEKSSAKNKEMTAGGESRPPHSVDPMERPTEREDCPRPRTEASRTESAAPAAFATPLARSEFWRENRAAASSSCPGPVPGPMLQTSWDLRGRGAVFSRSLYNPRATCPPATNPPPPPAQPSANSRSWSNGPRRTLPCHAPMQSITIDKYQFRFYRF